MARDDWFYVNLPIEWGETMDRVLLKEGKKYLIYDRKEMVRQILRDWLMNYEEKNGIVATRKAVRRTDGSDVMAGL